jgi:hypothetical protein
MSERMGELVDERTRAHLLCCAPLPHLLRARTRGVSRGHIHHQSEGGLVVCVSVDGKGADPPVPPDVLDRALKRCTGLHDQIGVG